MLNCLGKFCSMTWIKKWFLDGNNFFLKKFLSSDGAVFFLTNRFAAYNNFFSFLSNYHVCFFFWEVTQVVHFCIAGGKISKSANFLSRSASLMHLIDREPCWTEVTLTHQGKKRQLSKQGDAITIIERERERNRGVWCLLVLLVHQIVSLPYFLI